jgi:PAS domain-containing protein
MVQYTREDLVSGRVRWRDLTPPEWRDRDEQAVAELKATGTVRSLEKEYFRKDGSRVPVLIGAAIFEGSGNEGVAFVLDLSEQKRAEEALQRAQAELAHVSRVMTIGELTASIAHEINQPLSAMVTNANAGLRWLGGDSPDLEETSQAIRRIVRDGKRASAVVARMRALFKKAPSERIGRYKRGNPRGFDSLAGGDTKKSGVAANPICKRSTIRVRGQNPIATSDSESRTQRYSGHERDNRGAARTAG